MLVQRRCTTSIQRATFTSSPTVLIAANVRPTTNPIKMPTDRIRAIDHFMVDLVGANGRD
jgi:hypothetical protein